MSKKQQTAVEAGRRKDSLSFRQVHLDFHTAPQIPDIGSRFDVRHWQQTLQKARVNSVTCFAKCHHGWSYHPTTVGRQHPHLSFDLLRAQMDACREVDIKVPVYLSAGYDCLMADEHPDWLEVGPDGQYLGWCSSRLTPGYLNMDFHSPYLDYLCDQIEEVMEQFPDADGIFLDIIRQYPGCSRWTMDFMREAGLDPESEEDRKTAAEAAVRKYYERTVSVIRQKNPDMPIFHNSGHIARGQRDVLAYQSHLELESLPTGGWGYDHFPESALYAANLGFPYLGMTGKFHTTWGEFGGLKHPNALRYECSSMLAFGAACSVGDQLHPEGVLDASTYEVIGVAYSEVEQKEPWCDGSRQITQIAVLSSESEHPETKGKNSADTGASRLLLEAHRLFSLVDRHQPLLPFDLVILPDDILIDEELGATLKEYVQGGGKLLLTWESGLTPERSGFALEIGAEWSGAGEFDPDYILPREDLRPGFCSTPFVVYNRSQRIRATSGESLGEVYDPYFNRAYDHFCSHQHTPNHPERSGFDCGVLNGSCLYLAHPVFSSYSAFGHVTCRHYVTKALQLLLGESAMLETNLPSTARVSLTRQEERNRWILHLLYANTISRGGIARTAGEGGATEARTVQVIEDLETLRDVEISLKLPVPVSRVVLQPQGEELSFTVSDERINLLVPELNCHQMVVFEEL